MEALILIAAHLLTLSGLPADQSVPPAGGAIEGELMYPACTGLPEDLVVCAEHVSTGERYCTQQFTRDDGTYRYRLEVPAGEYEVYAETPSARPGHRAYFDQSVLCGLRVDCTDHTPIAVTVSTGVEIDNIHPADWFGSKE